jgi:hypothetical protein
MAEIIISNTSPLLYLHRIDAVNWLPRLCEEVWIPHAVAQELSEGMRRGYEVPDPQRYEWVTFGVAEPARPTPACPFSAGLLVSCCVSRQYMAVIPCCLN